MPEIRWNLLTDEIFTIVAAGDSDRPVSLPDVLALLSSDIPIEFAALQPHQFHAWHAFLVQLAAIAVHSAGGYALPADADDWRSKLLEIAGGDEPWCLMTDDLDLPAFMQPPVPERSLKGWSDPVSFPDELDVLVTAKNHDLKSNRMTAPRPEHWAYSLVTLQTSGGFDGRMNYGVARMNGGYGNRPSIAAARDPGWSTRFKRDVGILLSCRAKLIEEGHYGYTADGGHLLLWTLPWDGSLESQLSLPECDPFFIEVCRRVRLIAGPNGSIVGRRKGSAAERIAAKDLHGNVGDIWVPIRISDGAALTARDLSYKLLQEIIFSSDWMHSAASEPHGEDGSSPLLLATAMVRGQGKTDGLYERQIRVPGKARALLATGAGRERLGQRSREFVSLAAEIETKVLKRALLTLIQGGPDRVDLTDDRCKPLVNKLDSLVDAIFFDRLFDLAEADASTASARWSAEVIDLARGILAEGIDGMPVPEARRPRAIALAELRFNSRAREILGRYQTSGEEQSDERSDK